MQGKAYIFWKKKETIMDHKQEESIIKVFHLTSVWSYTLRTVAMDFIALRRDSELLTVAAR